MMNTLIKTNHLFPNVNSFFNDFISKDLFDWNDKNFSSMGSTLPSVNVKETENDFQIELAVPGMKKDDFKIELHNDILSISSEKKEEKEEKDSKGNYTRKEFNYHSFSRSFRLPETAENEKINASYVDGILHITISKKEAAKPQPPKTIAIK